MSSFVVDRPVVGPGKYFGREQLLRSLASGLARGRSFLLVGGPKIGRSSTLQQLIHQSQLLEKRDPKATHLVPVLLDLGAMRAVGVNALVSELYDRITRAVTDPHISGKSKPVRAPPFELSRTDDPWEKLATTLAGVWQALEGSAAWCRYLLAIDQGDKLIASGLDTDLPRLASFLASGVPSAPHATIIAGGRALREQLLESKSPLSFARPVFLGALKESEATALVSAPFEAVEEEFLASLLSDSGKHPYLLQLLLAEQERQKFEGTSERVARAVEPQLAELFTAVWHELDLGRGVTYRGAYAAPEHALMQYLIERPKPADLKTAERELGIKPLKEFAELLEYCGVVERVLVGDATCYCAPGRLWNVWYSTRIRQ